MIFSNSNYLLCNDFNIFFHRKYKVFYVFLPKKYVAPKTFKKIIVKLNPLFERMHAADGKDLIFFILEKLHQELNKNDKISEETKIDYAQLEIDSFDENKMLEHSIMLLKIT